MKICGNCGTAMTKPHETDADCVLALRREIHSSSSRLIYLMNHLDMDSDISKETEELLTHFGQMQEFMKLCVSSI